MSFPVLAVSFKRPQYQKFMKLFKTNDCMVDFLYTNISKVTVGITRGYCNCNEVTGSLIYSCSSSLPKEKERGSKGRTIYRAVGGQVTYATHAAPTVYALRVMQFITSTYTDNNLSSSFL